MPEKSWKYVQMWFAQNGFCIAGAPENFENIQKEGDLDLIHSAIWRQENLKKKGLR